MNVEDGWGIDGIDEGQGYKAWRPNAGKVSDLTFVPAPGANWHEYGDSYFQVISWQLTSDEAELRLKFQTSGQFVVIEGQGLRELKDKIVKKEIASVHEWSQAAHGPAPTKVVTRIRLDLDLGRLDAAPEKHS